MVKLFMFYYSGADFPEPRAIESCMCNGYRKIRRGDTHTWNIAGTCFLCIWTSEALSGRQGKSVLMSLSLHKLKINFKNHINLSKNILARKVIWPPCAKSWQPCAQTFRTIICESCIGHFRSQHQLSHHLYEYSCHSKKMIFSTKYYGRGGWSYYPAI